MTQHVVIVDDAETNLQILSAIVGERLDTTVHAFTSSEEALTFAQSHPVDAFVLDYHMPELDGRQLTRLLRADARFEFVPIVIVTAEQDRENRITAFDAGANDYIERPVEPREMLARLETLLALQAARRRLSENVTDLERSLRIQEQHSREQADRMVALWRIVTNTELSNEDVPHAILFEGARSIRPSHAFHGTLSRLDGDEVVFEAKTRPSLGSHVRSGVGSRSRLTDTLQSRLAGGPVTLAWDDIALTPELASLDGVRRRGTRSAICTSFYAGRTLFFLEFWSPEPIGTPFAAEDFTYIELLATYFAARTQLAWQFDRMTFQLSHDSLTGIRNRTQFRLDARAAYVAGGCGTMVVVSLDDFRFVNETYGHIIGDALLVEVAAALERRAIAGEIVARLAGDTFGIFIPGFDDEMAVQIRIAEFATTFEHAFATGNAVGQHKIPLSATFGVAIAKEPGQTIDGLLSHADTAAFAARRAGRGKTVIYAAGMESEEALRDRRLAELALALEANEFELYFQPHLDLETNRVTGAEALIRWNHPTRGTLLPKDFIPFAEAHGFIRQISTWVMNEALRLVDVFRAIDPEFRIYFNLSAIDLDDMSIVDEFRAAAARGAHLDNIGVELTETAAMRDMGLTAQTVKALQALGVRVAIDDFGVGYSSLSLLKRLPVDIIKIDRTFVSEILLSAGDAAIAEAVIGFGRSFGFETLGEGVETDAQLAWLGEHQCRYAQGYSIAHPLPIGEFLTWLAAFGETRSAALVDR
jgi:diguanylate cyclase (GGDEF)-like protein